MGSVEGKGFFDFVVLFGNVMEDDDGVDYVFFVVVDWCG